MSFLNRAKKNSELSKTYNISLDMYESMLTEQGGKCLICGDINKNGKSLFVDHNHETGEVRGLLCQNCNTAIGAIRERVDIAEKICTYLEYYKSHKYPNARDFLSISDTYGK